MKSKAYSSFATLVSSVLSVPHEEIMRREAEYRAQVEANPKRRGPKRGSKRKPKETSASLDSAADKQA